MAVMAAPLGATAIPQIRDETTEDSALREALLDRVMGPKRVLKTSERLRQGQTPAVSLAAGQGAWLVGTVRLWNIRTCGMAGGLLLGPLAVDQGVQGLGVGGALMHAAIARSTALGVPAILLVGDPAYYERFGFSARAARRVSMPGPFERHRLLGLELVPGALDRAHGVIRAGRPVATPLQPALAA